MAMVQLESGLQSDFHMYCKDRNIDRCKGFLKIMSQSEFLLNWAFSHSCFQHYYDLCLYMCETYQINYNHMNQECIFELLYNNDKHKDNIRTIRILKYIFKSDQIIKIDDSVINTLCKYCDTSIIMCFIKYFNGIIDFDNIDGLYLDYARIWSGNYMLNLGVNYIYMKPKFLL